MQHPGTDTGSPGPWWGRDEQTSSMHVPLTIGTGPIALGYLPLRIIPSHVSKLVAMETCSLPWLASNPEMPPILG